MAPLGPRLALFAVPLAIAPAALLAQSESAPTAPAAAGSATTPETFNGKISMTEPGGPVRAEDIDFDSPEAFRCIVVHRTETNTPETMTCERGLSFKASEEGLIPVGTEAWFVDLALALCCVVAAALAAGMTLGFTSLDPFQMQVLVNIDVTEVDPDARKGNKSLRAQLINDQRCAARILPVIDGHYFGFGWGTRRSCRCIPKSLNPTNAHYLLCTLLLLNSAANEALPLFLDGIVPSWLAVILSVTVVLIFGEIVPSALFTGPNQLRFASAMVPLVHLVRIAGMPIVWPLSLMLDKILGHQADEHPRHELKAMIRTLANDVLLDDEANILQGVLDMTTKTAVEVGRPFEEAKCLPLDAVIDDACLKKVLDWGHSRVFIYKRNDRDPTDKSDVCGVLLIKKLLGVPRGSGLRIMDLRSSMKLPVVIHLDDNLLSVMSKFQSGSSHLGIICEDTAGAISSLQNGISMSRLQQPRAFCSFEDIMEKMLRAEIYDEDDRDRGLDLRERSKSKRLAQMSMSYQRRLSSMSGKKMLGFDRRSSTLELPRHESDTSDTEEEESDRFSDSGRGIRRSGTHQ